MRSETEQKRTSMKDQIWVIGGYGQVGQMICTQLAAEFPGKVWAAGTRRERAEQFSRQTGGAVKPLQLDITKSVDSGMLRNVKMVIMCVDQHDTRFVESCAKAGTDYVDISAKADFLTQVERLHSMLQASGSTAILSVGLSPGITNLLVREAAAHLDQMQEADITIMLGLGEKHGKAAVEWTVDHMSITYDVMRQGELVPVQSLSGGKKIDFGDGLGQRMAYRFPFSDQRAVARTLHIPNVSTRLCLDSRWITRALSVSRRAGLLKLLRLPWVRQAAVNAFAWIPGGEPMFAVKVDVTGWKNGQYTHVEQRIVGDKEAVVTADVAAAVAKRVYATPHQAGVYHVEQCFTLKDIQDELAKQLKVVTKIS
ncbi:saccharopine dehydrogenase NADP-binding domain-containing protein [Paenibacillus barcinonensis]|uniref:Saccharopine dehydrogenase NADP-binding domain-containing protein n=1 Tax=Paenibacillus barcinonensis TaxID=198119 RepID=A0A2V4W5W0_PAEBA|nr:saccharopine dehydrogenase NADP-binding domain-containing protein [Paenibacillus barcinonensis]PYE50227.1 saccharopine dehydrogenase-like NADP-dependent oxidoreductase [Paenibacillus barcinonensis]QKS54918.1 saccharopine dehydrogenase NADP-binding domain-containing protein [Paenibacillus barcinonensis]